ncbi:hypothetical protein GCM10009117_09420 [Gangjinia marincola]|uniref:Tail specific protease domain-containing protein n=1 Tax=Gangjinia marincola TaxID=578463 RepID=A0ABN1MF69_9FLAO
MYQLSSTFFVMLVSSFSLLSAQKNNECSCKQDLHQLHLELIRTPAFNENKEAYKAKHREALEEVKNIKTTFDCFEMLSRLTLPLNDNHLRVYGPATTKKQDSVAFNRLKVVNLVSVIPNVDIDLDSLEQRLEFRKSEDLEGIYHSATLKVALYHDLDRKEYVAVVLEADHPLWERGEVFSTYVPYGKEYLLATGTNFNTRRLISYTEQILEGRLLSAGLKKDTLKRYFDKAPNPEETYLRKELSDQVTYLKIGSFKSFYPTLSEAEAFYETLEDSLNKPNLIIDLRDNTGGGDRNSDILYKIIKKYIKDNQLYILVNYNTASNAEQFAVKLMQKDNVTVLGQQTKGTIAYEIKDDPMKLSCTKFIAILPSKKHAEFLRYESQGIQPKVELTTDLSWMEQVMEFIEKK